MSDEDINQKEIDGIIISLFKDIVLIGALKQLMDRDGPEKVMELINIAYECTWNSIFKKEALVERIVVKSRNLQRLDFIDRQITDYNESEKIKKQGDKNEQT